MSWTFAPGSGKDPNAYYPGDSYVDIVGGDGYNWAPGRPGSAWTPFSQIFQNIYDSSVAHGKPLMAVEYGVQEDPNDPYRKAQWFQDALATIKSWPMFKGLIYFDENKSRAVDHRQLRDLDGRIRGDGRGPVPERSGGPAPDSVADADPDPGASTSRPGWFHPQQRPERGPARGPDPGRGRRSSGRPVRHGERHERRSSLTYDRHHALGRFSAKHVLRPGSDSYYGWSGTRTEWFGRLYVRLKALPTQNLRLIRATSGGALRCSIDVMPTGALQLNDQQNQPVVSTSIPVNTRRWVRIEWSVNHLTGKRHDQALQSAQQREAYAGRARRTPGAAIGSSADRFQFGRSGQPAVRRHVLDGRSGALVPQVPGPGASLIGTPPPSRAPSGSTSTISGNARRGRPSARPFGFPSHSSRPVWSIPPPCRRSRRRSSPSMSSARVSDLDPPDRGRAGVRRPCGDDPGTVQVEIPRPRGRHARSAEFDPVPARPARSRRMTAACWRSRIERSTDPEHPGTPSRRLRSRRAVRSRIRSRAVVLFVTFTLALTQTVVSVVGRFA